MKQILENFASTIMGLKGNLFLAADSKSRLCSSRNPQMVSVQI